MSIKQKILIYTQNFLLIFLGLLGLSGITVLFEDSIYLYLIGVELILTLIFLGVIYPIMGLLFIITFFLLKTKQEKKQKMGRLIGLIVSAVYSIFVVVGIIYFKEIDIISLGFNSLYIILFILLLKNK